MESHTVPGFSTKTVKYAMNHGKIYSANFKLHTSALQRSTVHFDQSTRTQRLPALGLFRAILCFQSLIVASPSNKLFHQARTSAKAMYQLPPASRDDQVG